MTMPGENWVTVDSGRHVLRLTFNPATAALYTRLEQRLAA